MKRLSGLLVLALVGAAFVLPSAPAHARFVGAAKCDVTLGVWPTTTTLSNSTDCTGSAYGTDGSVSLSCLVTGTPPSVSAGCSFDASVSHYLEVCGPGGTPPPIGTADGTLTVNGTNQGGYNWVRVGLTAVLVPVAPGSSAGVAAFVPHQPIPTCAAPGPLTATVVGVAAAP